MIKRLTFAALLLVLVLAACTPLSTPNNAIKAITATSTGKLVGITPKAPATSLAPTSIAPTSVAATSDSNANCTVVSNILPTPDPTQAAQVSLFKPVSDSDYILGNKEASITFLEYSDFQ